MTSTSETAVGTYLDSVGQILRRIAETQGDAIEQAAAACASAIATDHLVHTFGSGHSRILVEELWPRYGSFPGFHPIVELSLTNHHSVTGANGQRQAMFLENVPGFAARIARNFVFRPDDVLIAVSSSGSSVVTVELAELVRSFGTTVIAITSVAHSERSTPSAPSGRRLFEVADLVLDTCTPAGDAIMDIEGVIGPVGPTTTVAGSAVVNALKVRTAELLVAKGTAPRVLASSLVVGADQSASSFEDAYDDHARRVRAAQRV